jgi:hypothetical protein
MDIFTSYAVLFHTYTAKYGGMFFPAPSLPVQSVLPAYLSPEASAFEAFFLPTIAYRALLAVDVPTRTLSTVPLI